MTYQIITEDSKGRLIPGVTLTFEDTDGHVLKTLMTDAMGVVVIDDTVNPELLFDGTAIQFIKPGYTTEKLMSFQLWEDRATLVTLTKQFALLPVAVIGLGVGIAASGLVKRRKKRMAGFFDTIDPRVKTGAFIVGGIAVYYLLNKLFGGDASAGQLPDSAADELDLLAAQHVYPTISATEAEAYASAIVAAFDDCGTDEQAVYEVMQHMNNRADVLLLIKVYGTRGYKGCFDGDYFSEHYFNLAQAISNEMGSAERAKVNSILQSKGVAFSF